MGPFSEAKKSCRNLKDDVQNVLISSRYEMGLPGYRNFMVWSKLEYL